jgi:hypothetical protein
MSLRRGHSTLALAGIAVVLAGSGCGGDAEPRGIPQRDAQFLLSELEETQRRVDARACNDVEQGNLIRMQRNVDNMPDDVAENVRDALSESIDNLSQLVEDQCKPKPKPKPVPEPTPTETTPDTTTTEEQPTTTEEQPTEKKAPTEPDQGDEDKGSSGGGGEKNGGGDNKTGGAKPGAQNPGGQEPTGDDGATGGAQQRAGTVLLFGEVQ